MRELVYYFGMSIDGFIAGPDDEVEFYPGSEEYMAWMFSDYSDMIPTHLRPSVGLEGVPNKLFDTILMGRRTYEPGLREGAPSPYAHLRQYVFSRTLEQQHPDVEMVDTDPVAKVRELKQADSEFDICLAGGGELAGVLLSEIDRLVIKQYPVVAGTGRTAFGSTFMPTEFDLTEVKTFGDGGNAVMFYSRK
ncbi:dihydrofolate reductase [Stackebrandtia endophytica]|uniref:Dihydrofolate reductase n=1 Tax=Stackebrandtia endophytica TaxID=1496996 RepID=A0A543AZC0_9ACTN|nr:dihydrofolate reductase family protein [Stackebrandtia endophytica]TQL77932.1 dihydrofolate reductase [Stackebrandtia endophytica]